jgi:hypothetical protein
VLEITKLDWVPLICLRAAGAPSDEELAESLTRIAQTMAEDVRLGRKTVTIMDMRQASPLSASQRRTCSVWMKQHIERFAQTSYGTAFAIESPLVRGVLTALLWFQPIDVPHEVVRDLDAAVRWAIKRFEAERVVVPERLRSELSRVFERQTG